MRQTCSLNCRGMRASDDDQREHGKERVIPDFHHNHVKEAQSIKALMQYTILGPNGKSTLHISHKGLKKRPVLRRIQSSNGRRCRKPRQKVNENRST